MEISNGRQYQVMASYPLNEVLLPVLDCHKASVSSSYRLHQEINPSLQFQSQSQQALRCPRCASINTKFCYYNNYSLSQPRYFCKSCRRYWTQGGSLRNIPVGGGCRKNKRSSLSSSLSFLTSSSKKFTHIQDYPNPNSVHGFIDVLRSGLMGSTNTTTSAFGGIQSHNFGFGGDNGVMPPFDHGGLNSVSNSTATAATAGAITISHGGYLNGAGSTSWNGFINGFSDEMHDGHI